MFQVLPNSFRVSMRPSKHAGKSLLRKFLRMAAVSLLVAPCLLTAQDFGSVAIGSSSTATISVPVTVAGTVGSISVRLLGSENLDFTNAGGGSCAVATAYAANASCTVQVTFTPQHSGARRGAVVLFSGASDKGIVLASVPIQGIGSGPEIAFIPALTNAVIPTGVSTPYSCPSGVASDGAGDLYVNDDCLGNILFVPADGSAASWVNPGFEPSGEFVDGAGDLFVTDQASNLVHEWPVGGGAPFSFDLTANGVGLSYPAAPYVDGAGNLFISDRYNSRIVELPAGGSTPIAIAPVVDGQGMQGSGEVAVDAAGDLFITDTTAGRIIEVPAGGGAAFNITPVVNGIGLGSNKSITITAAGNLIISDTDNLRVVEIPSGGGAPLAFGETVNGVGLSFPGGAGVDSAGYLYLPDKWNNRVLKIQLSLPSPLNFATTPVGSTSSDSPQTVTVVNNGNAALGFPVPTSGSNPGITTNFTLNSSGASACPLVNAGASSPGALAAGASCLLPISFSPAAATPVTGTLVLTDSNLNAKSPSWTTQTISLSGGIARAASQTTINASAANITQGQSITLTVTVTGAAGAATPTGTVTISALSGFTGVFPAQTLTLNSAGIATWTSSALANGLYTVSASYSGDTLYGASTSAGSAQFRVIGPPASLVLAGGGSEGEYGGRMPLIIAEVRDSSGYGLPGVTVTMGGTGLVYQNSSVVTDSEGNAWPVESATMTGTLTATATVSGIAAPATVSLLVSPAPLAVQVHPSNSFRIYGAANPVFSATVTGLVNGDTLGGTITVSESTTATVDSGVGTYPVTVTLGGSSAANYTATTVGGSLRITHAPLSVLAKGVGATYGQTPPQPTEYFFYGFVNDDNSSVVSGAPILSTDVTATTPRGIYPIDVQAGTLSAANYKFLTVNPPGGEGSVRVYKAPLTVTANSVTVPEGGTVPPLTYTITGFVNGEDASVVSGTAALSSTVTSSTRTGEYPITVNVSGLSAENYYFVPAVHGGLVKVHK